jgi:hypothetical protein
MAFSRSLSYSPSSYPPPWNQKKPSGPLERAPTMSEVETFSFPSTITSAMATRFPSSTSKITSTTFAIPGTGSILVSTRAKGTPSAASSERSSARAARISCSRYGSLARSPTESRTIPLPTR